MRQYLYLSHCRPVSLLHLVTNEVDETDHRDQEDNDASAAIQIEDVGENLVNPSHECR